MSRSKQVGEWLIEPLPTEVETTIERLRHADGVEHVAVLPDVHLSGQFCVGTVVASRDRIFPGAVGSDIGCGMFAMRFEARATDVIPNDETAARILRALRTLVPTNRHSGRTVAETLPEPLLAPGPTAIALRNQAARDGRVQLGTLGRGNHFLEFQVDETGDLWVMVHSGSRAMGQAITAHHLPRCSRDESGFASLEAGTIAADAYLADVAWARAYADASRRAMVTAVSVLLETWFGTVSDLQSEIACDHNHVARETHFGKEYWIHRKGALPAEAGQPGVIPGSMGAPSYHVTGRGCAASLCSSSHGAGRALRRKDAARRISPKEFGKQLSGVFYDRSIGRRLIEEAPRAYKDIDAVMRAQHELTCIVRRVQPLLAYKGI